MACGGTSSALKLGSRSRARATNSCTASDAGDVGHPGGGRRAVQRRHRPAHLAGRAEQHPAGDHDPHSRCRAEQLAGQRGDRVAQVFRPVEHDQPRGLGQGRGDGLGQRHPRLVRHPEARGQRGDQRLGLAHGLQRDERDRDRGCRPAEGFHREPGLARPARPDQGQQPGALQQADKFSQLTAAADEARLGDGQRWARPGPAGMRPAAPRPVGSAGGDGAAAGADGGGGAAAAIAAASPWNRPGPRSLRGPGGPARDIWVRPVSQRFTVAKDTPSR